MATSAIPNLRRLRTERRLTQPQLATALGISHRTILRWEAGEGEPAASDLIALARYFGVSIDQLVTDLLPSEKATGIPKVGELAGRELDFWVAKAQGLAAHMSEDGPVLYEPGSGQVPVPAYSVEWAHGGPILENKRVLFGREGGAGWFARCEVCLVGANGETMLEAGLRAYLTAEFGGLLLT